MYDDEVKALKRKAIDKGLVKNRYGAKPVDAGGRLRMVGVSFLNAQPVLYGLLQGMGESRLHLELAPPAELSRRLLEDEADAALAPLATLAIHGGLQVVPDIAIACEGAVRSVLIVGDRPIEEMEEVLLDASSRTSVVLARLVVRHLRKGQEPRYCARPAEEIVERARGAIGGLLIGDAALEARHRFPYVLDLGQAWQDWTGLPFVFAVWMCQPGVLEPWDTLMVASSLEAGLAARTQIASAWQRGHGGDARAHEAYLNDSIRYRMGPREIEGARTFLRLAAEAGLLPPTDLHFVGQAEAATVFAHRRSVDDLLAYAAEGGRLSYEDAMRLGREATTTDLGLAADQRRRALHPEQTVTYIVDRNINYTNVCTTSCRFCAFYRPVGHQEGYVLSREELAQKIQETVDAGGIQILLQGGLNPALSIEWYEDLFRWMKSEFSIALHALSPEEILHLAYLEDLSVEQVLTRLKAAGMDSVPGGGAEVLTDRVRRKIAKAKCTSAEWLEVMRIAHRLGMRSSATMMFGTSDHLEDRVLHMLKLRDLQDETGGFTAFICWDYQHEQGVKQVSGETGTVLYLRTQALARLVIDNIENIQSSWVTQGPGMGQIALRFGANDMGSTMFEENVVSSAGTTFGMDAQAIESHVHAAGFKVARRNQRYDLLTEPS